MWRGMGEPCWVVGKVRVSMGEVWRVPNSCKVSIVIRSPEDFFKDLSVCTLEMALFLQFIYPDLYVLFYSGGRC
jgi:hypothetical protein